MSGHLYYYTNIDFNYRSPAELYRIWEFDLSSITKLLGIECLMASFGLI